MNLQPLLDQPLAIQIHVFTVVPAALIGLIQLIGPKGTPFHKALGYIFITLMIVTAVDAFFVRGINGNQLSWIHLFIPLTFFGVTRGLWAIKHGNVKGHRAAMIALYVGAILIAGGLTFIPGRLMHLLFFGN